MFSSFFFFLLCSNFRHSQLNEHSHGTTVDIFAIQNTNLYTSVFRLCYCVKKVKFTKKRIQIVYSLSIITVFLVSLKRGNIFDNQCIFFFFLDTFLQFYLCVCAICMHNKLRKTGTNEYKYMYKKTSFCHFTIDTGSTSG